MSLSLGHVVGHERDRYRLWFSEDLILPSTLRGALFHAAVDARDLPVIGDRVGATVMMDQAVIERIEPRRSLLVRKGAGERGVQPLAANVDYVLIASSLNQDLSLNRLHRYAVLAWDSGAQPVFVLTKRDLEPEWQGRVREVESHCPGVRVHALSADDPESVQSLREYTRGTVVVVGSSGVGKSTLLNRLLGEPTLRTQDIRDEDSKGRHTTTSRSMWPISNGGWVIDTPGLREVQMFANEDGLEQTFQDIADLSVRCRFGNCGHGTEPGCQVNAALTSGALSEERWASYLKLEREIAHERRKIDPLAKVAEKAKWKAIHKEMRRFKKR